MLANLLTRLLSRGHSALLVLGGGESFFGRCVHQKHSLLTAKLRSLLLLPVLFVPLQQMQI